MEIPGGRQQGWPKSDQIVSGEPGELAERPEESESPVIRQERNKRKNAAEGKEGLTFSGILNEGNQKVKFKLVLKVVCISALWPWPVEN